MSFNFIFNSLFAVVVTILWFTCTSWRPLLAWLWVLAGVGSLYDLLANFLPARNISGMLTATCWIVVGWWFLRWLVARKEHIFLALWASGMFLVATNKGFENRPNKHWWQWTFTHVYDPLEKKWDSPLKS